MLRRKDKEKKKLTQLSEIIESRYMGKVLSGLVSEYKLMKNWQSIIGSHLSLQTNPGRIKRGVLHIKVSNSVVLNELYFLKKELLLKVNSELGRGIVKDIKFEISNLRQDNQIGISP